MVKFRLTFPDLDPTAADYNVWHVWNGALQPDPFTGGNSLKYTGHHSNFDHYFDVLVKDTSGSVSDVLRFSNNDLYPDRTFIRFYSADTSGGAPADTGLPTIDPLYVVATVYENSDGIFYWTSPSGSQWVGYSEGRAPALAPEPATMLLLGLGLIGVAGIRRKLNTNR